MNNQKPKSRMHHGLALTCHGNTLVPILIALAISIAAGVTFLKQGTALNEKTIMLKAPDDLMLLTKKFKEAIKVYEEQQKQYIAAPETSQIPTLSVGDYYYNIFQKRISYWERVTKYGRYQLHYWTENSTQCQQLVKVFIKHPDVSYICCACSEPGNDPAEMVIYHK